MERNQIIDLIQNDERVKSFSKPGFCRSWTREAIRAIRNFPDVGVEAREVDIGPCLQHTFLRVTLPGVRPLLLDGTGVGNKEPYFGYEDEAPKHLQNSHPDTMINSYIK
jgi:hypothetical protein